MQLHERLRRLICASDKAHRRSAVGAYLLRARAVVPPNPAITARQQHIAGAAMHHGVTAAVAADPAAQAAAVAAPVKALFSSHASAATAAHAPAWVSLGVGSGELRLEFTLPTGQSFRWRQLGEGRYIGVLGTRVVEMQQTPDDVLYRVLVRGSSTSSTSGSLGATLSEEAPATPSAQQQDSDDDDDAVRGYFNLSRSGQLAAAASCSTAPGRGVGGGGNGGGGGDGNGGGGSSNRAGTGSNGNGGGGSAAAGGVQSNSQGRPCTLAGLADEWSARDPRFAAISPYFPGARMLRQDPVECLFQFICSSNNHISRIHGMVERLCRAYGTPLPLPQHLDQLPPQPHLSQPLTQDESRSPPADGLFVLGDVYRQQTPAQGCGAGGAGSALNPAGADPQAAGLGVQGPLGGEVKGEEAESGGSTGTVVPAAALGEGNAAWSGGQGRDEVAPPATGSLQGEAEGSGQPGGECGQDTPQKLGRGGPRAEAPLRTPDAPPPAASGKRRGRSTATDGSTKGAAAATAGATAAVAAGGSAAAVASAGGTGSGAGLQGLSFYAFPTLDQLSAATEQELRDAGFGYRAKFIVGSVAMLQAKEGGGHAWLMGLRQQPYKQVVEQLCTLPGIGPKVAACVALFSLDKHEAIPVDTHVWQVATRYYLPHLRGKALTKKVHEDVQRAFEKRFGPYAGWAHNTLFISELASQRERLPEALRSPGSGGGKKRKAKREDSDSDFDAPASGGEGEGQQVQDAVNLKGVGRGMVDEGLKAEWKDEGAAKAPGTRGRRARKAA